MEELSEFFDLIINMMLAGTRMTVVLYTVPFIHQSTVVPMVRNAIVLAFMIPLLPMIMSYQLPQQKTVLFMGGLFFKEALIGFVIGFLVSIVFWAAQCAGRVIDMQRGSFFAIMTDPLTKSETTPMGNFLFQLATILFFVCGGFREMIGAIIDSHSVWPVHRFFPHMDQHLVDFAAQQLSRCLNLAVIFAAPIVISALMADLALGMLNRFAPQVNVFMISLPTKSTIASFILVIYISFYLKYLQENFMGTESILHLVGRAIR